MFPNLYVIARPNGAGKSLFSATLADTDFEVFDGDKYISRLQQQFPETGSDIITNRVNEVDFREAKETAIRVKGNFAFTKVTHQSFSIALGIIPLLICACSNDVLRCASLSDSHSVILLF